MSGVNKVILVGNLGADPDLRYTPGGQAVCDLRLATNESWTAKDGSRQEHAEWHRVVVWGTLAENCAKYLARGREVYIEGKNRTKAWEDKDGNKRYTTKVVARDVQFLGGRGGGEQRSGGGSYDRQRGQSSQDERDIERNTSAQGGGPDDDIPF